MTNAFSRSWEITKITFDVIKKDKELLLFPLIGGIFSILFIIAMIFPTIITSFIQGEGQAFMALEYVVLFVTYLGLAFIATFFNVCVVYTTKKRFAGGNATFGESIQFAFSKIHLILAWSLVSATVGIILRLIDHLAERLGWAGKLIVNIITGILGMVWSIITIFVVPSMVYHDLGPIAAIKKSAATFKKTWGESLIRAFGMGFIEMILIIAGIILGFILVLVTIPLGIVFILGAVSLMAIYFLTVILIFRVANSVFNTALFVYADTGKIPSGYSKEVMHNAFSPKQKGRI